jgi:hypothetical protein
VADAVRIQGPVLAVGHPCMAESGAVAEAKAAVVVVAADADAAVVAVAAAAEEEGKGTGCSEAASCWTGLARGCR